MFTNSILGDHIWQLWIILLSLTLFIMVKEKRRYLSLLLILLTYHPQPSTLNPQSSILNPQSSILNPQSSIQLVNTNIDQDKKWNPRYLNPIRVKYESNSKCSK